MANEAARRLRKNMTPQEVKLWVRLRALRAIGTHFRRQSPIGPYIVDFECRRSKLIVEVDGGQHNVGAGHRRDEVRDKDLMHRGYLVLRIWNHEIDRELDAVIETICRSLLRRQPHPTARVALGQSPSPAGEG